jgi:hypothetical protein
VTGCGCLLLVGALVALLYVLVRGSTDAGEPVEQAIALASALALATQLILSTGARRRSPSVARS